MPPKVVVIGAGISGLTCAYRLLRLGLDVSVLEEQARAGGVMLTDHREGFLIERGPSSFRTTPEIVGLIEDLQLQDEVVTAPPAAPRYIYFADELHAVPMSPLRFLGTPLLQPRDKLRILLEPFAPRPPGHEETVAEFIVRRFGPRVLERFVQPFVSGVYAGDPDRLSAQAAFPLLTNLESGYGSVLGGLLKSRRTASKPRFKPNLCSFRQGISTLPKRLAERLGPRLLTNRTVIGIQFSRDSGSPRFEFQVDSGGRNESMEAGAIVLATPAGTAARILGPLSREVAGSLQAIDYPPLVVVGLGYERSALTRVLDGFGFLVVRGQGLRILGCIWNSSLFPGRAPEGSVCLTCFLGGTTDRAVAGLTDGSVGEIARRDIEIALGVSAEPTLMTVYRHAQAIPQYLVGHPALRAKVEARLREFPGLFLAGNYLSGVAVADCIREATRIAERIATGS